MLGVEMPNSEAMVMVVSVHEFGRRAEADPANRVITVAITRLAAASDSVRG
jgi:hypothetical protein